MEGYENYTLSVKDVVLCMRFFKLRFGREPTADLGYFSEWLYRFSQGHNYAKSRMDSDSLRVFNKHLEG